MQPSRRPADGRYGENPNRLQHYYQYQVILKPNPPDLQDLYLGSLAAIGIDTAAARHPLRRGRLGEPHRRRLGPGLGGLVRRHGGDPVHLFPAGRRARRRPVVSGELTYGLERLAMYVQGVDNVYDLTFNDAGVTYGEVFLENERQQSAANFEAYDVDMLQAPVRGHGGRGAAPARRQRAAGPGAGAAGLRPRAEGQPPVQPDGRPRRHRGGRAPELHRPHPRPVQSLRGGLGGAAGNREEKRREGDHRGGAERLATSSSPPTSPRLALPRRLAACVEGERSASAPSSRCSARTAVEPRDRAASTSRTASGAASCASRRKALRPADAGLFLADLFPAQRSAWTASRARGRAPSSTSA